jgi:hypothetical protein
VRVSTIGASWAPFGITITVYSLTPSRIGIMASRLMKSRSAVGMLKVFGMSLEALPG